MTTTQTTTHPTIVTVKLFALAAQRAGAAQVQLTMSPGSTVADLRRQLAAGCPQLASLLPHVLIAVNAQYASNDTVIPAGAELACIPPVSGG